MFSLNVVDTDNFLEMPISSRLLYYELGMRADDDGFVDNWKKILMFTGLKEDDMKVLISKQFIIPFESGIIVIKHWRLNNYLQKDRTKPTIHQEELRQLNLDKNNVYSLSETCIHSIDKNRLVENSIDKNSINNKKNNKINNIENLYEFVEQNFGRTLSPLEYEEISKWEDNELTRYAIKEAVLRRALNIKYINAILNDYKAKGIKSTKDIQKLNNVEKETNVEVFDYDWLEEEK